MMEVTTAPAAEVGMLTAVQAAHRLGVTQPTIHQLVKRRVLNVHSRGHRGASLFLASDIEALRKSRETSVRVLAARRRYDRADMAESVAAIQAKFMPGGELNPLPAFRFQEVVPAALTLWQRHAEATYGHTLQEMVLLLGTARPEKVGRFLTETRSLIATGRIKKVGQSHEHGGGGVALYRVAEMPARPEAPRRINRWPTSRSGSTPQ
jgi:hypothetical protein